MAVPTLASLSQCGYHFNSKLYDYLHLLSTENFSLVIPRGNR
jgi:hypothetical protein